MPRRTTRQVTPLQARVQIGLILAPYLIAVGIVFACILLLVAFYYPWVLLLIPFTFLPIGYWWYERRQHLKQQQLYQWQQLQAAHNQQQWFAYHQHQQRQWDAYRQQRISQQLQERQRLEQQRIQEEKRQEHQRIVELQRFVEEQERLKQERLQEEKRLLEQQRQLGFAQDIGKLLALTPREFELAIGELLKKLGYQQVRHTGKAGDLAADLHAVSPRGERVIVQCKRYAPGNGVGSGDIQKFIGMRIHHQAQRALFVTTSTFKDPAIKLARQHGIELIDGEQLVAMFARVNKNA